MFRWIINLMQTLKSNFREILLLFLCDCFCFNDLSCWRINIIWWCLADNDLECDGYAPRLTLDDNKLNDIPLECPTLDLIDNVISSQDKVLSHSYSVSSSSSYRRNSPFYASSPSSGYSGSPPPNFSNEPSPCYIPSPAYPALSSPTLSQTSQSPACPDSVNLDFRDLEEINAEDLVGTKKKTDSSSHKSTKRPSSIDDESKPSPPKRTNVDAMYDKDLDEDKWVTRSYQLYD